VDENGQTVRVSKAAALDYLRQRQRTQRVEQAMTELEDF